MKQTMIKMIKILITMPFLIMKMVTITMILMIMKEIYSEIESEECSQVSGEGEK